jgi:hypothetical protein
MFLGSCAVDALRDKTVAETGDRNGEAETLFICFIFVLSLCNMSFNSVKSEPDYCERVYQSIPQL